MKSLGLGGMCGLIPSKWKHQKAKQTLINWLFSSKGQNAIHTISSDFSAIDLQLSLNVFILQVCKTLWKHHDGKEREWIICCLPAKLGLNTVSDNKIFYGFGEIFSLFFFIPGADTLHLKIEHSG